MDGLLFGLEEENEIILYSGKNMSDYTPVHIAESIWFPPISPNYYGIIDISSTMIKRKFPEPESFEVWRKKKKNTILLDI
jgi:hypothetical protein